MKLITKRLFFVIVFCLFCFGKSGCDAKINDLILDFDQVKEKLHIKKKQPKPKPKMVETKQEWEIEAQNIPLEDRKFEKQKQDEDEKPDIKKENVPDIKYKFVKYNYPQGGMEVNFDDVKNKLYHYSFLVADGNFKYAAYPHFYYSPESNQIYSNFFVEKLDTSKNKTRRIIEFNHKQKERIPVVESGVNDYYPNLFNAVTLVDWSRDSKKLLIKERVGSLLGGVYKTYVYVHFLENDVENSKTIKLDVLDETIKYYFLDWENTQLVRYRYDIQPIGFCDSDDDIIVAICWVYDNDGNKLHLGTWGYNLKSDEVVKFEKTPSISVNGFYLKETY